MKVPDRDHPRTRPPHEGGREIKEEVSTMTGRLKKLGVVMALLGVAFIGGAIFAATMVAGGYNSLQEFSAAQNVTLSYNEDGELVDRGTTEQAQEILALVRDDWGYAVVEGDLDPNDPLVNTGTEYMYQMGLISYHVMHGTYTVTLDEDVEYNGEVFEAGTYEISPAEYFGEGEDGKMSGYWTDFDRMHPIEGAVRGQAWSGVAHGLIGELGVGSVTASTLQLGLGVAGFMGGVGATLILLGAGLFWAAGAPAAAQPAKEESEA